MLPFVTFKRYVLWHYRTASLCLAYRKIKLRLVFVLYLQFIYFIYSEISKRGKVSARHTKTAEISTHSCWLSFSTVDEGYHGHEICIYTCTLDCHGYLEYEVQCIVRIPCFRRTVKKKLCILNTTFSILHATHNLHNLIGVNDT